MATITPVLTFELQKKNVTPKEFYNFCKWQLAKRWGRDLEAWASYEDWAFPPQAIQRENVVEDEFWEGRLLEKTKITQRSIECYLYEKYHFILDFNFDDTKKTGWGYMFLEEYE